MHDTDDPELTDAARQDRWHRDHPWRPYDPQDAPDACTCDQMGCEECWRALRSENMAALCDGCDERCLMPELLGIVSQGMTLCEECRACEGCGAPLAERLSVEMAVTV